VFLERFSPPDDTVPDPRELLLLWLKIVFSHEFEFKGIGFFRDEIPLSPL